MKLKIVVHTGPTEEGDYRPGQIVDIREGTAEVWVQRGWAIPQPDLEEKKAEPPPPVPEKTEEVIETPEDHHKTGLETATMRRRRKTAE